MTPYREPTIEAQHAKKRRCSATWARLISKVFQVDPLTCAKCGGELEIIAYLHDQVSISKILHHLGLSPPEPAKPPPAVHEVVRVPVDEEGREIEAPEGSRPAGHGDSLDLLCRRGVV